MAKDLEKQLAERFFVQDQMSQSQIATQLRVSVSTVSKWAKDGHWQKKKDYLMTSPAKLKELLYKQIQILLSGEAPTIDTDNLSKVIRALERIDSKITPDIILSVLKDVDSFAQQSGLSAHDLYTVMEVHQRFLQHTVSQGGT